MANNLHSIINTKKKFQKIFHLPFNDKRKHVN